jgi:hypothetical protein
LDECGSRFYRWLFDEFFDPKGVTCESSASTEIAEPGFGCRGRYSEASQPSFGGEICSLTGGSRELCRIFEMMIAGAHQQQGTGRRPRRRKPYSRCSTLRLRLDNYLANSGSFELLLD